jgi:hypothetical protein
MAPGRDQADCAIDDLRNLSITPLSPPAHVIEDVPCSSMTVATVASVQSRPQLQSMYHLPADGNLTA